VGLQHVLEGNDQAHIFQLQRFRHFGDKQAGIPAVRMQLLDAGNDFVPARHGNKFDADAGFAPLEFTHKVEVQARTFRRRARWHNELQGLRLGGRQAKTSQHYHGCGNSAMQASNPVLVHALI
jgi:hypothetical protein